MWANLLKDVVEGACPRSFKDLYAYFFPLIVSSYQKSGLGKEVSHELAQDCMVKVWKSAKSFDPAKGSAASWIFVIARNAKYDYLRKVKNDVAGPSSQDLYRHLDQMAQEQGEDSFESLMDFGQARKHLFALPHEQRLVLEEIYLQGFSQQQISQRHGVPLGTIKSRARLGMRRIKKLMGEN